MPIYLIDKIKQKNNLTFFLMDATDVCYDGNVSVKAYIDTLNETLIIDINASGHELTVENGKLYLLDAGGNKISQVDLPEGGKIDTISVNGVEQPITNKNVNIVTPVIEILESED